MWPHLCCVCRMFEGVCSLPSPRYNSCANSFQRLIWLKETQNSEIKLFRESGTLPRERGRPHRKKRTVWSRRETRWPGLHHHLIHNLLLIPESFSICNFNSSIHCSPFHIMNTTVRRWDWRRLRRQYRAATRSCRWTSRSFSWLWHQCNESEITRGRRRRLPFRRETGRRQRLRGCK